MAASSRVVLVVDDEPASQRAIRRALGDEARVVLAASAAEGLGVLRQQPVALVLTDQRMPGMSGIEFLGEAVRQWPQVVRVILTAYADGDTLREAINTGHVYFFLTKPWQPLELRLVVRRGLERHQANAERARLLAELEVSYTRARRDAEQKGRLLALTAHELGTPVHILVNAIALWREAGLPAAARPWAHMAARATAWLARGLAEVRSWSALREPQVLLRPRPLDLGLLAARVVAELQRAASSRAVRIETSVRGGPVAVTADRRWLRLALWNLISNAIRFTPDGGAIFVTVGRASGVATVAVRDTGIGIDPADLDGLGEPFSSAGGDVALHGSGLFDFGARGLGLGLAIVKDIIAAHGGTFSVTSTPRAGTCVEVRLGPDVGG